MPLNKGDDRDEYGYKYSTELGLGQHHRYAGRNTDNRPAGEGTHIIWNPGGEIVLGSRVDGHRLTQAEIDKINDTIAR